VLDTRRARLLGDRFGHSADRIDSAIRRHDLACA